MPTFRKPKAEDGSIIYNVAKEAGGLDVNSEYAYLLTGAHHSDTSVIAEEDGIPAGFTSAYCPPGNQNVLFVWQIAIAKEQRRKGLARQMLKHILERKECQNINYVQATVTPSNIASKKLFSSLAGELETEFSEKPFFSKSLFSEEHEEEFLVQVGPIKGK